LGDGETGVGRLRIGRSGQALLVGERLLRQGLG
jgi:hypothetical protein